MNKFDEKLKKFENKICSIYPNQCNEIFNTHKLQRQKIFRINFLKANEEEVLSSLREENFVIVKLPIPNSYKCISTPEDKKISESKMNLENKIYIQELSSMLPVMMLDAKKGEKILDMCASPGSKTTQLASIMKNEVEITAIEKNKGRFFKLKEIIRLQGVENVRTILQDANKIPIVFPELIGYFDKILLDAPCTTESKINFNNVDSLKLWHENEARKISKLQKGLLNTSLKLLKKGGSVIYSTCTYSVEENEGVIDWMLRKNEGNVQIQGLDLGNMNINSIPGLMKWKEKTFNNELTKTLRIIPDENFTSFFIAKLTKS